MIARMDPRSNDVSRILVVGPPAHAVGGMATVAAQMTSLRFDDRYRAVPFATTESPSPDERLVSRIARHVLQSPRLAKCARRHRAAIVHIHTCSGFSFMRSAVDLWAARRSGRRVVLHMHGGMFDRFYDAASPPTRRWVRDTLTRADRVIALSNPWRETLGRIAPGASIRVIENAVSLPKVLHGTDRTGPCRLLMLGRMDTLKGVDELLHAARTLAGAGLAFEMILAGPPGTAGDGPSITARIGRLGLAGRVRYVGPVRGREKVELLQSNDVYVQPSRCEALPLALLEAMSHALPVVATDVGAVSEVLHDDRAGLLVPGEDPDRLAAAIRVLIDSPGLRRTMGDAARQRIAANYGIERLERQLTELYDELTAEHGRRQGA